MAQIGGRPNDLISSLFLNAPLELFTVSMHYLYKQPYFHCQKEKNDLSFVERCLSHFILAIESQHIILMSEVAFYFFVSTT